MQDGTTLLLVVVEAPCEDELMLVGIIQLSVVAVPLDDVVTLTGIVPPEALKPMHANASAGMAVISINTLEQKGVTTHRVKQSHFSDVMVEVFALIGTVDVFEKRMYAALKALPYR